MATINNKEDFLNRIKTISKKNNSTDFQNYNKDDEKTKEELFYEKYMKNKNNEEISTVKTIEEKDLKIFKSKSVEIGENEKQVKPEKIKHSITVLDSIGDVQSKEGTELFQRYKILLSPLELRETILTPDEIFTILMKEFPWFEGENEHIASSIAINKISGSPSWFKTVLLNGPPGIGKTRWGKKVSHLLNCGFGFFSFSGINSSMGIKGSERGWSNCHPGIYADIIKREKIANPVILLDEIDKAIASKNGDPHDALLPFLERETSSKYEDPCFLGIANLSKISYILTSNDDRYLSSPLQSRVLKFDCRLPTSKEVESTIPTVIQETADSYNVPEDKIPSFDYEKIINAYEVGGSMRSLVNEVEKQLKQHFWKSKFDIKGEVTVKRTIGFRM